MGGGQIFLETDSIKRHLRSVKRASVTENTWELGQVMARKVSVTQTNSWLWIRVIENGSKKQKLCRKSTQVFST